MYPLVLLDGCVLLVVVVILMLLLLQLGFFRWKFFFLSVYGTCGVFAFG